MKGSYRKNEGFSLIELLVVIALIALLSTVALLSFSGARGKARDAKRKADLHQVQTALGVFYDNRGMYPTSTSVWDEAEADYGAATTTGAASYLAIAPYISENVAILPMDPLNPDNSPLTNDRYIYRYVSDDGDNFAIVFETENDDGESPNVLLGW